MFRSPLWLNGPFTKRANRNPTHRASLSSRLKIECMEDRTIPSVAPVGSEFQINSIGSTIAGYSVKSPDVAMDATGAFVVTWQTETELGILFQGQNWSDVHARRFDATGQPLGEEFNVIDGTTAPGNQEYPSVAMGSAGNFIVAWADVPGNAVADYGATSIWARQYDAFGHALAEPFLVDSGATLVDSGVGGIDGISVAADAAGNFVVVYSKWEGSTHGIYARRYDAGGHAEQALRVDTSSLGGETVAMNANGEFVVAWHGPDGRGTGVYARKFDADGLALSGQVSVSFEYDLFGAGFQGNPSAAINAAGEFAISWVAFSEPDPGFNNYVRRFDASGQPLGNEFRINSHIGWIRSRPEVAMDAAGDFVAAWSALPPPTFFDYSDAFAQAYTAAGEAVGPTEFVVNTNSISGPQVGANVAMNAAGNFVITWAEQLSPWIRAQRYSGGFNQPPLAPTVTVPATATAFEDLDKAITGISVGDVDSAALTVTLNVGHGTLTLGSTSGLSASGNGTGAVSLTGSLGDLNAALSSLVYRGALNFSGNDSLSIWASDGSLSTSGSVAIAVQSAISLADDLQARVNTFHAEGVLNDGQTNSLDVKLNLKDNTGDIGKVQSFLNQVAALFNGGILTQSQFDELFSWGNILLLSVTRR